MTSHAPQRFSRQRGAALLMAMVIVSLVSTLAASMLYQQYKAVQVEGAVRVRTQGGWILYGLLDYGRHFLRDDARRQPGWDDLTETWALPMPESRLSSFLAADKDNNAADDTTDNTFVSGGQTDAQAKYNLRNLVDANGAVVPDQVKAFERLCNNLGMSSGVAALVADRLRLAVLATKAVTDPAAMAQIGGSAGMAAAPVMPQSFDDLLWLGQGLDAGLLERLRPYVTLLPGADTKVNVNTASKEVIAAVAGVDVSTAQRAVQARQRKPFHQIGEFRAAIGPNLPLAQGGDGLTVASDYFEAYGRLRYEDYVIVQQHLLRRSGQTIEVLSKTRLSGMDPR